MLNIITGKVNRAVKTVIYGTEGVGKSTLAAQFPNPLFIDVEGGTSQMDIRRIAKPQTWEELLTDVNEVAKTPDICGTLVLDTADWAETLCVGFVCSKYKQNSIEGFGYGRGYTYLSEEWSRLMAAFDTVIAAGINVTIIAHARQRKVELPDQTGSFDHWEMKVSKQVAPLLKEWADLLLFLNYRTFVVTTENNSKKATGGKRTMFTSHSPVWDAKNRHNLPEELDLDFEGIAHIFSKADPEAPAPIPADQLRDLMTESGVSEEQLRKVVAAKGHYPEETPVSAYSEKFVNDWCIKHWSQIVKMIQADGSALPSKETK